MKIKPLQKYFFFLIVAISSCGETTTINRPDVSHIAVDVNIERFDKELAAIKVDDIPQKNIIWQQKYGSFYSNYTQDMLQIGSPADSMRMYEYLSQIIMQPDFIDLNKAVAKVYPSMDSYENDLTKVFKYVKYYFPEYSIPRFISYVSGFAYQTPIGEDYIGIGLDMFLGEDSEFYPALVQSIPLYLSRKFTPDNIVPRVLEAVLREDLYPIPDNAHNTLQHMIYNGKVMYAMDLMLEKVPDERKIGYTKEQWDWANKYQADIWSWFLQENLLYSTDMLRIQKYFTEAPFTPELGEKNESAPKLGTYIGWMIVRKYMDKNPTLSLQDLFAIDDAQKILEDAKYKGK
ncbi:MAG: gliding motility lipoprotein GldB [Sphingobacterium composti]